MTLTGFHRIFTSLTLTVALSLPIVSVSLAEDRGFGMPMDSVTAQDFTDAASYGANSIRMQYFNYNNDTDDETAYRAWVTNTVLPDIQARIAELQAAGLTGMITLLSPPGGRDESTNPPTDRMFLPGNQWMKDLYVETWQRIAQLTNGSSVITSYLIISEPGTGNAADWKALSALVIAAINGVGYPAGSTEQLKIIPTVFGNPQKVNSVEIPANCGNCAIGANFYFPFTYTHQGIYNNKEIRYPGCRPTSGKKKKRKKNCTKRGLKKVLKKLVRFSKKNRVPVVIGEYAVVGWAPGATRWIKDTTGIFRKNGWSSYFHSWGEANVWDPRYDGDRNNWQLSNSITARLQQLMSYFTSP